MASNKELAEQAEALGKLLRQQVKTQGLNNAGLTDLVATLTAQRAALLPQGHKRPAREEFVGAGYQAENYDSFMTKFEDDLVSKALDAKASGSGGASEGDSPMTDGGEPQLSAGASAAGATPPPSPLSPAPAKPGPARVAPGHSITCLRGVLTEGQEISGRDLTGALNKPGATQQELEEAQAKALDELVAGGHVVRS
jgi:hypothetical protein